MIRGLKYPRNFSNDKIADTYEKLAKSVGENTDIKIGKIYFSGTVNRVGFFFCLNLRHTNASSNTSLLCHFASFFERWGYF